MALGLLPLDPNGGARSSFLNLSGKQLCCLQEDFAGKMPFVMIFKALRLNASMNWWYGGKAWARQSLGKAEPQTHPLDFGEPRNRSGTVGAIRSCLRIVSACGFETSATVK